MWEKSHHLDTTVNLVYNICVRICIPICARGSDLIRDRVLLDAVGLHKELHVEASGGVPGNVAMEWPYTGVGWVKLHHDVSVGLHLLHVAALRVAGIGDDAVPGTRARGEHVHVVAVKMDGVTIQRQG